MENLLSKDNLIIFTTAPTGLGHIRVMDALLDGLPEGVDVKEVGVQNISAAKIHRLGSVFPFLQKITEFYQTNPMAEKIAAGVYKAYHHSKTKEITARLKELKVKFPNKKNWLIVSTHHAFAHEIEYIKGKLERNLGIKILLFVIMTDDSPQRVWVINNADIIFSPSERTSLKIHSMLKSNSAAKIITISFPVSPRLTKRLTDEEFNQISGQFDNAQKQPLHIEIPISGAAVQLDFFKKLIDSLKQEKIKFTIVGQDSIYTKMFFTHLGKNQNVGLLIGRGAKQTVNYYESLFYQSPRPGVEITKPSEQCFKSILKPNEQGGVVLLLTNPVGRQEQDNLNFLVRHDLIPDTKHQEKLFSILLTSAKGGPAFGWNMQELSYWTYRASHWRGVRLPSNSKDAAEFIINLKQSGILLAMLSYVSHKKKELTSGGVAQIWEEIDKFLGYNKRA
ncbi:hypothetical protein A3D84_05160 [Candidatus Woesebacteria bacterium RIFCSPHIGHO2_02_FULL_42_20]|uniref:Diacylglycerol glucosyltransferase N-terminal domain-containing protein n=1 Tax=Candidatus Woesebacteria bacterium RIFCSPHIGHO2_12_FULL_41_24 TaxID=1802510 RepID=A0A1F8AUV6_9BACT|nr:MAG: hypothetical protein A2W15_00885 [Candidatus Woesebacteria bacterium RBG_16_41_13]OGM30829.1 MAG: hypothetical protein A2873_04360 [Candidatus Woesebacteria bacterium RIFCSPHIGHO2_01_FULL_42_80]OGM34406.1 MAG: hypothetical protein A3D84_05160 [Candidatus Woesebacteria bacterium RIFCSPHIGHO2_02_FULL_42_20]OGM55542.1 MAG: hypothetical protein A3E44_01325 [Candidatus Woesebacteria bacterium RIFCSPHIGHO2_12_FULL_41_24]OGM66194.1 MAG: hypothetical protein A2969_01400 [Candidatus Woesebacteri